MDRKRQKFTLEKIEVQTQCQEEEVTVLRQKIMSMEAELKLKDEEKHHLANRVTSLEQELEKKNKEQEYIVKQISSLEQELAKKENQLQIKIKEQERLKNRVISLEQQLQRKVTQLQLIKEPFDALPNEVVVKIFKHLTQNELGKIARVCQRWNELTQSSVLWQKVNVEFHISHINAIVSFINRLPCSPTSITVHFLYVNYCEPLDFQKLCAALRGKCHQLEQLVLERSKFASSLPSVVDLCTRYLPNMTSLALPFPEFFDYPKRVQCTYTSRIKILDVSGLWYDYDFSNPLFSKMPCLKELNLSQTYIRDLWSNNAIFFLNQIEILHLGYISISYGAFEKIKSHGLNLKELYMCGTPLGDRDLSFDTPAFPQMEIICLSSCEFVTCEGVVSLLQSCPSLQNIYVDNEAALSYARHPYVIANPGKLGIVKNITCSKHIKKYY